jgi:hypothetical protein
MLTVAAIWLEGNVDGNGGNARKDDVMQRLRCRQGSGSRATLIA